MKIKELLFGKKLTPEELIKKYREFSNYELDIIKQDSENIYIPKKLPSEPEEGIQYEFGQSGYYGSSKSNYCVIKTTWHNPNNYCHWSFSELPFLILAFESGVDNIVLPEEIINVKMPFQKRWLEVLISKNGNKNIVKYNYNNFPKKSLFPVNNDTTTKLDKIQKANYRNYHTSRATPYLIKKIQEYIPEFRNESNLDFEKLYINRKTRRLKNEDQVQAYLKNKGFEILNIEEFSLDQQVQLFNNAKVIIGFHGAGLANVLFCNNKAKIVEIVDIDCVHPTYLDGVFIPGKKATRTYFHMLAHMKNLDYTAIESKEYYLDIEKFNL